MLDDGFLPYNMDILKLDMASETLSFTELNLSQQTGKNDLSTLFITFLFIKIIVLPLKNVRLSSSIFLGELCKSFRHIGVQREPQYLPENNRKKAARNPSELTRMKPLKLLQSQHGTIVPWSPQNQMMSVLLFQFYTNQKISRISDLLKDYEDYGQIAHFGKKTPQVHFIRPPNNPLPPPPPPHN